MNGCRIGRRIAWTTARRNTPRQAAFARTWATKVFHLLSQSFPGGGRAAESRPGPTSDAQATASGHIRGSACRAGVCSSGNVIAMRRFASRSMRLLTPCLTPSLATNDAGSGVTW